MEQENEKLNGTLNAVLKYANQKLAQWRAGVENMNGYKSFTTFYADLTIADFYGPQAVRDTYKRVNESWRDNYKYYTEFVLCLNHKIWEHYDAGNEELARVYDEIWREADEWAGENYKGEAAEWYFNVTD